MKKPVVMVVDDEKDVADSVANIILDTNQYEVVTVSSAKEALAQLSRHQIFFGMGGNRIRFIFADIKMPGMDGLEFLEKVRHDFGSDIGLCILSAWEDQDKWERATSSFVVNYVKKPFSADELTKTLERFFQGKEAKMVLETFEKHMDKRKEFEEKSATEENAPKSV